MELTLLKPEIKTIKDNIEENGNVVGEYEIFPFEEALGSVAFGNALRAVLMVYMPGYAVTNLEVHIKKGHGFEIVPHIFCALEGFDRDMTAIFLNIKRIKPKLLDGLKERNIEITKKGPCLVKASDLICDDVEIINPDLVLFELVSNVETKLVVTIREGRGYKNDDFYRINKNGNIPVDANFSPIVRAVCKSSKERLGGADEYEKLNINIETNNVISPLDCLKMALKVMKEEYSLLCDGFDTLIENEGMFKEVEKQEVKNNRDSISIKQLGLSNRPSNALEAEGINTIGELKKANLKKIRNLGKKSIDEINEKLAKFETEGNSEQKEN